MIESNTIHSKRARVHAGFSRNTKLSMVKGRWEGCLWVLVYSD